MGTHGVTHEEQAEIAREAKIIQELEHQEEMKTLRRWVKIAKIDKEITSVDSPQLSEPVEELLLDPEIEPNQYKGRYGPFLDLMLKGPQVDDEFLTYVNEAKKQYKPPHRSQIGIVSDETDEGWTRESFGLFFQ